MAQALCCKSNLGVVWPASSELRLAGRSRLSTLSTRWSNPRKSIMATARATVCIGDLHGYSVRFRALWRNLELHLGASEFASATIIFLGDYCDRGPDTAGLLDFLSSLQARFPLQKHVFLSGNHDFGFLSFLGLTPPTPDGFSFASTWEGVSEQRRQEEGWWSGPGVEHMHLQARRWAGRMKAKFNEKKGTEYRGSIYDSEPTFNSYGVQHGDREGLIKAVPYSHKKFLQSLLWVYEQDGEHVPGDPSLSYSRLIAVHAGLEEQHLENQLAILRNKDVTLPRVEALCGRHNVWNTPRELADSRVLVVSGHHGKLRMDKYRLIIDESGGMDHLPLAAMILPERSIVRDTDVSAAAAPAESELGTKAEPLPA